MVFVMFASLFVCCVPANKVPRLSREIGKLPYINYHSFLTWTLDC